MDDDIQKLLALTGVGAVLVGAGTAIGYAMSTRKRRAIQPSPTLAPQTRLPRSAMHSRLLVLAPPYGRIGLQETETLLSIMNRMEPGPFGLVIHALGGFSTAVDHLARAMKEYGHPITAYVPYRAMSGGTLLALAATEIVMSDNAILGPVDPQLAGFPAHSIATLLEAKPIERMSEEWYVLALESKKAIAETTRLVGELVKSPEAVARLTNGDTTHGLGITAKEAKSLGLPVRTGIPPEVFALADQAIASNRSDEVQIRFIGRQR